MIVNTPVMPGIKAHHDESAKTTDRPTQLVAAEHRPAKLLDLNLGVRSPLEHHAAPSSHDNGAMLISGRDHGAYVAAHERETAKLVDAGQYILQAQTLLENGNKGVARDYLHSAQRALNSADTRDLDSGTRNMARQLQSSINDLSRQAR
jgi:hypothetical protein